MGQQAPGERRREKNADMTQTHRKTANFGKKDELILVKGVLGLGTERGGGKGGKDSDEEEENKKNLRGTASVEVLTAEKPRGGNGYLAK